MTQDHTLPTTARDGDLRAEAAFLLDRLIDFENDSGNHTEAGARDWSGHVRPSIARLTDLLAPPPAQDPVPALGLPAGEVEGLRTQSEKATPGPFSVSGARTKLGDYPMLKIVSPDGRVWAYVPYSDLTPADHVASHADASLFAGSTNFVRTHVLAPPASAADGRGLQVTAWAYEWQAESHGPNEWFAGVSSSEPMLPWRRYRNVRALYETPPPVPPTRVAGLDRAPFRTGDLVRHKPSDEIWTVAYCAPATGYLAACGYPYTESLISDCVLHKAANDQEHQGTVQAVLGAGGARAERLRHMLARAPTPSEAHSQDLADREPCDCLIGDCKKDRLCLEDVRRQRRRELARATPGETPGQDAVEALCDRLDRLNTVTDPQACADAMDEARAVILASLRSTQADTGGEIQTPAPAGDAVEALAWSYEWQAKINSGSKEWFAEVSFKKPCHGWNNYRNVRPLYAALDAIAQGPGAGQAWQPVETAPKDGTVILLGGGSWIDDYFGYSNRSSGEKEAPQAIATAYWADVGKFGTWAVACTEALYVIVTYDDPTHWMPLPAAPATAASEGDAA